MRGNESRTHGRLPVAQALLWFGSEMFPKGRVLKLGCQPVVFLGGGRALWKEMTSWGHATEGTLGL
jgi:hypothetical protein